MIINKGHEYFTRLQMVVKCRAKRNKRHALTHIEVNKEHIVATNGVVLGCLDNFGLEIGRYKCWSDSELIDLQPIPISELKFPPYKEILPKRTCFYDVPDTVEKVLQECGRKGVIVVRENLEIFMKAKSFLIQGKSLPIVFFNTHFIGLVLPIMT